ncbi:hypothetical protein F5Y13DRAFT_167404 [Hypoxylon sp. FL1857]|nr:hypothetical protein F5Y13DRAFT_167404 [Hypoxylon sp. FL1857]
MSLLDLPPELLRQVIVESMPEGFESLLLSCRPIYDCGKSLIALHNTRKEEWEHVDFDKYFDYMPAFSWLLRVTDEPVLLRYIKSANFRSYSEVSLIFGRLQWDDAALNRIKKFIEESPYLRKAEHVDPQKWADMAFDNVGSFNRYLSLMTTFFLTLLPNVETLALSEAVINFVIQPSTGTQRHNFVPEVWSVMEAIRETAEANPKGASLGKLTELRIERLNSYTPELDLQTLSPFLVLPNLITLYVSSCVAIGDGPVGAGYRWHYPDISSGLRTIDLQCTCMDITSLSQLLSHTPHLISFKCGYALNAQESQCGWDAGTFIATVGEHVGSHLEELDIRESILADENYDEFIPMKTLADGIVTGVTSMTEFTKLKSLRIPAGLFCGPSVESGERRGKDYTPPREGFMPWTIEYIPPLAPMLPPSLEALTIVISIEAHTDTAEVIKKLFVNFAADRQRRLPNLKSIDIFNTAHGLYTKEHASIRASVAPAGAVCSFDAYNAIEEYYFSQAR